jgi:transposase
VIPGGMRVLLAVKAVDLRRSIDGLQAYVVDALGHDPKGERMFFVFTNTKRDRVKVLWRDTTGWCVLYKRFDEHRVPLPSTIPDGAASMSIDARLLAKLLDGVPRRETAKEVARKAKSKAREMIKAPMSSTRV